MHVKCSSCLGSAPKSEPCEYEIIISSFQKLFYELFIYRLAAEVFQQHQGATSYKRSSWIAAAAETVPGGCGCQGTASGSHLLVKVDSAVAAPLRRGAQVKGRNTYNPEVAAEDADGFPITQVHRPHCHQSTMGKMID